MSESYHIQRYKQHLGNLWELLKLSTTELLKKSERREVPKTKGSKFSIFNFYTEKLAGHPHQYGHQGEDRDAVQ